MNRPRTASTKELIDSGIHNLNPEMLILVPKYCSFKELSNDMLTLDVANKISEIWPKYHKTTNPLTSC